MANKQPAKKAKSKNVPRGTLISSALKGLGQQIMLKRTELGWNLQDLSKKANVSYVIISKIEKGLAENANISSLIDITSALSLDLQLDAVEPQ